jgi:hypothetical protein
MILSNKREIESYRSLGYMITPLQQDEGAWDENQQWIGSSTHNPFLPPPPPPFSPPLSSHEEPSNQRCDTVHLELDLTIFPEYFHLNNGTPHLLPITFPRPQRTSDFYRQVTRVCTSLSTQPIVQSFYSDGVCHLSLSTMLRELSHQSSSSHLLCQQSHLFPRQHINSSPPQQQLVPLEINYEPLYCTEPLWCNHTMEFQRRLDSWQSPSLTHTSPMPHHRADLTRSYLQTDRQSKKNGCERAKYLLYEPNYHHPKGIPGMLLELSFLLRFALCHGRILYLTPLQHMIDPFEHVENVLEDSFCSSALLECLFHSLSRCSLTSHDILMAPTLRDARQLNAFPLRDAPVVKILKLPTTSHCSSCTGPWTGNMEFFDGLHIGLLGYVMTALEGGNIPDTTILDILDQETKEMGSFSIFMDQQSSFWMSEMMRYLLRPQRWLSLSLREYIHNHLLSTTRREYVLANSTQHHLFTQTSLENERYASFHLSDSVIKTLMREEEEEGEGDPLEFYLAILSKTSPHITQIFLSTTMTAFIDTQTWRRLIR